jgi:hypothetical protein
MRQPLSPARPLLLLLCVALVPLLGCKTRKSPRQQIQEAIAAAEAAAEAKDLPALTDRLSKTYAGAGDLDRAAVVGLLRLQLLRAQSIHLLVLVPEIAIQAADRAAATVLVGMASTPIASAQELASASAALYRFELLFALEDGIWRVTSATWSPATAGDFL